MHTLRADGARKVLQGITSVAEVLRATEEEASSQIARLQAARRAGQGVPVYDEYRGRRRPQGVRQPGRTPGASSTPRAREARARSCGATASSSPSSRSRPPRRASPRPRAAAASPCPPFSRISSLDLALLTRQASTLVGAGIPLVESLGALTEQAENPRLKSVLGEVRDRVNQGTSLADAFAQSKAFPDLYVSMVRAGEAGGALEHGADAPGRLPREPGAAAEQGELDPHLSRRDVRLRNAGGGRAGDGGAAPDHRAAREPQPAAALLYALDHRGLPLRAELVVGARARRRARSCSACAC